MKKWIRNCAAAISLIAASASSFSQENVKIAVGSFNLNNVPYYVALGLHAFDKEGLKVSSENFGGGGSITLQALLTGSIDLAIGFYDHTIQLQSKGKDLVAMVQLARNSGLVLAVSNNATGRVTDTKSLIANAKSLKFGITSPGSSSDFFLRYLLTQHGVDPINVQMIAVGSGQAAVMALKQGNIDVLINYDPAATLLTRAKIGKILIDARTDAGAKEVYGGIYPTSTIYTTGRFLATHKGTAQKVATAMVKTLRWMSSHTPEEIAEVIPSEYKSGDTASYVAALSNAKTLFSQTGEFVQQDLETPYKVLQAFSAQVKNHPVDLKKTYTNELVSKANQGLN
jgi:NitT/TauT family transport system substrate-binding protein